MDFSKKIRMWNGSVVSCEVKLLSQKEWKW